MPHPQMIIVGGPNGAGKTTFALKTIKEKGFLYIGADKIAAEIAPENPASVALTAGRIFIDNVDAAMNARISFIVETTLSGKSFVKTVQRAKAEGYAVAIQMVFVDSPFASVERVARRVRSGGHDVPESDVLRRFPRSLKNFWNLYRHLADRWLIVYNSGQQPVSVATLSDNVYNVQDEGLLRKFFELGEITNDF